MVSALGRVDKAWKGRSIGKKAIVLLDPDGVAVGQPILCAEAPEEADALDLPLLADMLVRLSAGKELRATDTGYELLDAGDCVAVLEIFPDPRIDGVT